MWFHNQLFGSYIRLLVISLRFNVLQMNIMDSYLFFEGTVHLFKEHYVDNERFIRGGDVRSSCPVLPRDVCRRNATQGVG